MAPSPDVTDAWTSSCAGNCSGLYSSVPSTEFWCSDERDAEPWILLDLGHLHHVTGIDIRLPLGDRRFDNISLEGSSDGKLFLSHGYTSMTSQVQLFVSCAIKCMRKNTLLFQCVKHKYRFCSNVRLLPCY